jgi:hypothetical protein
MLSQSRGLKMAEFCHDIQILNVSGCYLINDTGIISIAEHCHKITSLNISLCSHISDIGVIRLAECCRNIEILNVARCHITDASITRIADLCHNIKELDISGCDCGTLWNTIRIAEGCVIIKDINVAINKNPAFYENYFRM